MEAQKFNQLTQGFTPISLDEMDNVKLLRRVDSKYVVPAKLLPQILEKIKAFYLVLEIGKRRSSKYRTLYYDTPDFQFFMDHHNKLKRRIKVRKRTYLDSEIHYFEVKQKRNDETKKHRKLLEQINTQLTEKQRLKSQSIYSSLRVFAPSDIGTSLIPTVMNEYTRITLVKKDRTERCTIDLNLTFFYPDSMEDVKRLDDVVIIEVKSSRLSVTKGIAMILRKMNYRPQGFSKYVNGVIELYPTVKCNNFKPMLLNLEKIVSANLQ